MRREQKRRMRIRRGEEVGEKNGRKGARKGLRNELQKGERTWLRMRTETLHILDPSFLSFPVSDVLKNLEGR